MGVLARILERLRGRRAGQSTSSGNSAPEPLLTPSMQPIEAPKPTPSMRNVGGAGRTAGTPSYGAPHGTPSTQRIHNPTRPGR